MGASLQSLLHALEQLNNIVSCDEFIIDLSKLSFIHPFLVLPLCSLISDSKENGKEINFRCSAATESYLDTINFPGGFDALSTDA